MGLLQIFSIHIYIDLQHTTTPSWLIPSQLVVFFLFVEGLGPQLPHDRRRGLGAADAGGVHRVLQPPAAQAAAGGGVAGGNGGIRLGESDVGLGTRNPMS